MLRSIGLLLPIIFSLVMMPNKASAGFYNGNDLTEFCRDNGKSGRWFCVGYIAAVIDVVGSEIRFTKRYAVCVPDNASLGQVVDVVMNYLETHPELRHLPAARLTIDALREVWRC